MSTELPQPHEPPVAGEDRASGASSASDVQEAGGPETDQLREEIAQTREQLGNTVEALAGKADVKGRVNERVEQRKEQLHVAGQRAQAALSDPQQAKQLAITVRQQARDNLPVVAGAVLAVAAWVLVRRRRRRRY